MLSDSACRKLERIKRALLIVFEGRVQFGDVIDLGAPFDWFKIYMTVNQRNLIMLEYEKSIIGFWIQIDTELFLLDTLVDEKLPEYFESTKEEGIWIMVNALKKAIETLEAEK